MLLSKLVHDIVDLRVAEVVNGKVSSPEVLIRTSDGSMHTVNYITITMKNKLVIDTTIRK